MKSLIVIAVIFTAFSFSANSQHLSKHAIGVRINTGSIGNGGEASYQLAFGDHNRLELDAGARLRASLNYRFFATTLTPAFHWDYNIVAGFNWFVGPAAQIGFFNETDFDVVTTGLIVGGGAQGGVEYNFNHLGVPVMVSVDARPLVGIQGSSTVFWYSGAASVRYTFGD